MRLRAMLKNFVVFFFACCFSHHALSEVILIAGAPKRAGLQIAEKLVSNTRSDHIVYAGLKPCSNRAGVNRLLAKYPTKIRVVDLDVHDDESLITAIKIVISREGRIDTIINFGEPFTPRVEAMIDNMRSQKSVRNLEILSRALNERPELFGA